jgi:hypothetical protein
MKERTSLGGEAVIFILFWIIASILWGMWLEGISIPILGLLSAVIFRLVITLIRWIDAKF